nr:MAG TPA: hypothetical protein [Caudoviricetes sp.]
MVCVTIGRLSGRLFCALSGRFWVDFGFGGTLGGTVRGDKIKS